jgi:hypothetical protein
MKAVGSLSILDEGSRVPLYIRLDNGGSQDVFFGYLKTRHPARYFIWEAVSGSEQQKHLTLTGCERKLVMFKKVINLLFHVGVFG